MNVPPLAIMVLPTVPMPASAAPLFTVVRAADLPHGQWPYRLFYQDWTSPALGSLVRRGPDDGVILGPEGTDPMPFDSRCGTLPQLKGFGWRL